MAVEAIDAEKLTKSQIKAIVGFFGTEIPRPGDWLFEIVERNRTEKLFVDNLRPFYLPRRQLAEGVSFPGLKQPLDPWLYEQMRAKRVEADADWLPEGWILLDVTRRPNYDNGKQMYPDTPRFKKMLADLRERGQIAIPNDCRHVRADSRFAVSPDEIDGKTAVVSKAVADILGIEAQQVTTPKYSTFNYIGNLADPEFGQADTAEWFADRFGYGYRLCGGYSVNGGLSNVFPWPSVDHLDRIAFRLQFSSPSKSR